MSANMWLVIAIIGFSLSGVALATAVFMFFKMRIIAIIGDLSGKTVAREIKAIRDNNASSGDKSFRSSSVNLERGTLTEQVGSVTDILSDNRTEILYQNSEESDSEKTICLNGTEKLDETSGKSSEFNVVRSVVITHADKVI